MGRRREIEIELRESWTGRILLEQWHLAEMRETVRVQLIVPGVSMRRVAAELEVSPRRVTEFVRGAGLALEDWEAISRWCADKAPPRVEPDDVALGLLTRLAPRRHACEMRTTIARAVLAGFAGAGARLPLRVVEVLDRR
jgi:hypothetical protein